MEKLSIIFKDFGAKYPLAIYGLLLTTIAFLVESPFPGFVIADEMRGAAVVTGVVLVIISLFRPRKDS